MTVVPVAQALDYGIRLPAKEAVAMAKRTGAAVHHCRRLGDQRFRCEVTYWKILHTAEEVEPGHWVEISAEPVAEDAVLEVTTFKVRRVA